MASEQLSFFWGGGGLDFHSRWHDGHAMSQPQPQPQQVVPRSLEKFLFTHKFLVRVFGWEETTAFVQYSDHHNSVVLACVRCDAAPACWMIFFLTVNRNAKPCHAIPSQPSPARAINLSYCQDSDQPNELWVHTYYSVLLYWDIERTIPERRKLCEIRRINHLLVGPSSQYTQFTVVVRGNQKEFLRGVCRA